MVHAWFHGGPLTKIRFRGRTSSWDPDPNRILSNWNVCTRAQEIGDKEAEVRQQEAALGECEREQRELEGKRNAWNDQRKELWRAEAEAEKGLARMKADRQRAEKKVRGLHAYFDCPLQARTSEAAGRAPICCLPVSELPSSISRWSQPEDHCSQTTMKRVLPACFLRCTALPAGGIGTLLVRRC